MGVDAGDLDNDGDEDLVMTELTGQGANLYINDGSGAFEDRSGPRASKRQRSATQDSVPRGSTPTTTAGSISSW